MLLISYLRTSCLIQDHTDFHLFPSMIFIVLVLTFRSFACEYQIVPALLVEKTILSSLISMHFLFNFRWICKTFTWFQGESYIAKYTRVTFASNLVPPHSLSLPINSHFTTVGFFFSVSICKCNKFHIYIYLYSSSMCVYIYTYTYTHVYLYLFNLFYIKYSLLFTGEGNGNPLQLQCSCLENSTDRGPWWVQSMGLQRV